jgi:hypothetical protein
MDGGRIVQTDMFPMDHAGQGDTPHAAPARLSLADLL